MGRGGGREEGGGGRHACATPPPPGSVYIARANSLRSPSFGQTELGGPSYVNVVPQLALAAAMSPAEYQACPPAPPACAAL